jgi:glutathione S-transferase
MSGFIVHGVPGSPYGRAVLAALIEKGQSFTFKALAPGGAKQPDHLAKMPFGRIPLFEHGSFVLYETQAILRYLERIIPEPPLSPADPRAAARMDQLIGINDWYLFGEVGRVIAFQRIIAPKLLGAEPDEAVVAAAMPRAEICYAELDRLLGDQPYLTGDALTLADLMIAPHLDLLAATPEGEALLQARPRLAAWLARVLARPSFTATTWEAVAALAQAA